MSSVSHEQCILGHERRSMPITQSVVVASVVVVIFSFIKINMTSVTDR